MPFKSEKQRRFMWAKHPEIAKRWADEAPKRPPRSGRLAPGTEPIKKRRKRR